MRHVSHSRRPEWLSFASPSMVGRHEYFLQRRQFGLRYPMVREIALDAPSLVPGPVEYLHDQLGRTGHHCLRHLLVQTSIGADPAYRRGELRVQIRTAKRVVGSDDLVGDTNCR